MTKASAEYSAIHPGNSKQPTKQEVRMKTKALVTLLATCFISFSAWSDTLSTCNEVSSQINATTPIIVDKRSTLKSTGCFRSGATVTLTYIYSLDFGSQAVTQADLNTLRARILNGWCTNPDQRAALNIMNIEAQYSTPNGRYIGSLTFNKKDC